MPQVETQWTCFVGGLGRDCESRQGDFHDIGVKVEVIVFIDMTQGCSGLVSI